MPIYSPYLRNRHVCVHLHFPTRYTAGDGYVHLSRQSFSFTFISLAIAAALLVFLLSTLSGNFNINIHIKEHSRDITFISQKCSLQYPSFSHRFPAKALQSWSGQSRLPATTDTFQTSNHFIYFQPSTKAEIPFKFPLQPPVKCTPFSMPSSTSKSILRTACFPSLR